MGANHCASPAILRKRIPQTEPINAATNQTHPCKLPVETPEKNAPTLHPNASLEE